MQATDRLRVSNVHIQKGWECKVKFRLSVRQLRVREIDVFGLERYLS